MDLSRRVGSSGPYMVDSQLSFLNVGKWKVSVLRGFTTDGISGPWFSRFFLDRFASVVVPAAVIHDGLYGAKWTSKLFADWVFFLAVLSCCERASALRKGFALVCGLLMFAGVALGGWIAWWKKSAESVVEARKFVEISWSEK